jgi:hypothetical protein
MAMVVLAAAEPPGGWASPEGHSGCSGVCFRGRQTTDASAPNETRLSLRQHVSSKMERLPGGPGTSKH